MRLGRPMPPAPAKSRHASRCLASAHYGSGFVVFVSVFGCNAAFFAISSSPSSSRAEVETFAAASIWAPKWQQLW